VGGKWDGISKYGREIKGLGRMTIQIFDKLGVKVVETLSESDGYFSYLGLKPGKFTVKSG
jgi:hypothetical protein